MSVFSFKKYDFADRAFTLMLVYRNRSMQKQEFFQMLQYLVTTYCIDIIVGNFNYDLLKLSENKILDIFTDHFQTVDNPTHISRFSMDHIYIKKRFIEEFFSSTTVENIYFLDHAAAIIMIEKNAVDFHIIPKNPIL